jgi:hypothetical protein
MGRNNYRYGIGCAAVCPNCGRSRCVSQRACFVLVTVADARYFGSGHAPFSLPFQKRCASILRHRCPTSAWLAPSLTQSRGGDSWVLWKSCRLDTGILHLISSLALRSTFSHSLLFPCISWNTQYGPIRMRPRKAVLISKHFRDGFRTVD